MIFDYLKRGLLAGGVAGVAYGLFLAFVANPLVTYLDHAQHGHGHTQHADPAHVVSESTTALASIGGGMLWTIFLGGLLAVALYLSEPALPGQRTVRSYLLSGAGFLTISVTPWLVLPPSAPGAEQLYGVDTRMAIYAGLVVLGAAISAMAILAYKRTAPQHHLLGVGAGVLPILATIVLLPTLTPTVVTHPGLETDLVGAYQAMVVLSQGAVWLLIAATFGWLQRRNQSVDVSHSPKPASGGST